MNKGIKIGLAISGVAIAGLAAYLISLKMKEKKAAKAKEEADKTPAAIPAAKPAKTPVVQTIPAATPPKTPYAPASVPVANTAPTMGQKIFSGSTGANAYKSASSSTANLYKYYSAGKYIGTYLGKDGTYAKVIVEESGIFSNSNVTVWVPSKDIVVSKT